MKISFKDIIKPALPLIIICFAVSAVLSLTNLLTKDRIAQLEEQSKADAMRRIFDCEEYTEGRDIPDCEYYIAGDLGLIFNVTSKGYGGDISVMVGVNNDGTVKAVEIIDVTNETVGLGQNAAKPEFYTAYEGKTAGIEVVKNGASGNSINALTGATITSQAVTDAVNKVLSYADTLPSASTQEGGAEQ